MNKLVKRVLDIDDNCIQVSGVFDFEESRWREAVLFFLNGIWSGNDRVTYRTKITFGGITLRLDGEGRYYGYGRPYEPLPVHLLGVPTQTLLLVGDRQAEVQDGLIRFVRNNQFKMLVIIFSPDQRMFLWKKEKRGRYGCSSLGLPISD